MSMPDTPDLELLRSETRRIWEGNATFWDSRFGEGNTFHTTLIEPAVDRLLDVRAGEDVLEIGCGNGAYARHLAAQGARVLATDLSATFLTKARERTVEHVDRIEYRQLDVTDEAQLSSMAERRFDAVVSNMSLMDMPAIEPLFAALTRVLRRGGRFVYSVMHPCFNTTGSTMLVEENWDQDGAVRTVHAMKVSRYLRLEPAKGIGIRGQPEPHYYFHRPLHTLLGVAFRHGFVLDGLEEPAFPDAGEQSDRGTLTWENYSEIPPVLVARLRPGG
jgi:SAM-dependent methyltransferase